MAKFKFRPPIIKLHPKHIVFELVSRLAIITNDTRIPKFSRRNRIERKMVVGVGGERKLRRKVWKEEETRRRNEGSTQAGSRAHGVLASCTRWGSDLNLGLETWTGESSVVPPSTTPSPYFSRRPRKISIRCPRACCCTRCGGEGEGDHCDCIMQRGAFLAAERRRRRTCIDRIPRTVETVLRKKNITALKYKGDRR